MNTENKENVHRPRFSVRRRRQGTHRIRHHTPGTRYIPFEKRINVIADHTVVPPKNDGPSGSVPYDSNTRDPRIKSKVVVAKKESNVHLRPPLSAVVVKHQSTQWQTPIRLDEEPEVHHNKPLTPVPLAHYSGMFDIVPGEAYSPVPLYINRDLPWELRRLDDPTIRRVHYYQEGSQDPRRSVLRVEIIRLPHSVYFRRELQVNLEPMVRDLRVHLTQMRLAPRNRQ